MADMIDAVVLIQAMYVSTGGITSDSRHWEQARASHHLVDSSPTLLIAAISWYEVMRGMTEPQREALKPWRSRIDIIQMDANVANRAAELHIAARKSGKLCPKCFCFKKPLRCEECGNQRSQQQRSNDIVMVATADATSEASVLYSWDGGVLELGKHVSDVQIKNPPAPPPQQIELLRTTDIREGTRARKARTKRDDTDR